MTKSQVLFSLRQRINHVRELCERDKSSAISSSMYEYYAGRIDAYDMFLEMLCDYD